MKLLLTSAGVCNGSIWRALEGMLGKPVEKANAVYVGTAVYALPGAVGNAARALHSFSSMGWGNLGIMELTALPSVPEDCWLPDLEAADALLVMGGNTGYLSYWMYESGLADRIPGLLERGMTYVGLSAGSLVVSHSLRAEPTTLRETGVYYDDEYDEAAPKGFGSDRTLKLVDFVIRPHLGSEYFPQATLDHFAKAAERVDAPLYAIDDQTAISVVDGTIEVVSEGTWKLFNP